MIPRLITRGVLAAIAGAAMTLNAAYGRRGPHSGAGRVVAVVESPSHLTA